VGAPASRAAWGKPGGSGGGGPAPRRQPPKRNPGGGWGGAPPPPSDGLVVRDLAVSFGGVAALGGITFAVKPDTITSLIGPNGAGKTTAFDAITGYIRPTRGEIRYGEASLTGLRPCDIAARGIVRTFQRTSVFPQLTVTENVMIGLHLRGTASLSGI